jgi:dolichyl-diphosphooligosaccharide---protein glycosyltransferase
LIHGAWRARRSPSIAIVSRRFGLSCCSGRFNYRATEAFVNQGLHDFLNWFDARAWYPLGRIGAFANPFLRLGQLALTVMTVGGTVYPGLMFTSGLIHYIANKLTFIIHIRCDP